MKPRLFLRRGPGLGPPVCESWLGTISVTPVCICACLRPLAACPGLGPRVWVSWLGAISPLASAHTCVHQHAPACAPSYLQPPRIHVSWLGTISAAERAPPARNKMARPRASAASACPLARQLSLRHGGVLARAKPALARKPASVDSSEWRQRTPHSGAAGVRAGSAVTRTRRPGGPPMSCAPPPDIAHACVCVCVCVCVCE